jgi:hypothetical protein
MKLIFAPALAAVLLTLASPSVRATPLDDRVAELKHAVEKEAAARANGGNNPNGFVNPGMSPAFIEAQIDQVLSQIENPAYGGSMDAQLAQITSMFTSTEVQEASGNLLNEIKKERKDKADAEIADVKALIARAGQAVMQAKRPEDLDDLIETMSKHGNSPYGENAALQADQNLSRQFSSAFEFVKQWQNYLAHLAGGQTDQARNDLQNLSNSNYGEGLLPRSKLLELESPDKLVAASGRQAAAPSPQVVQAQAILDGMKTLDDIKPALARLEVLRDSDSNELSFVCGQLRDMQTSYDNLKAGLPSSTNFNAGYNAYQVSAPAAIRSQLVLFTLQTRLSSFRGPLPAPGEKPVDFVDRVIADATSRQDWELLRQATNARGILAQNPGLGYDISRDGVESIIAATHFETAGQFALAVRSYEQALQSDSPAIPAKIIGDKLAAIQRDHPKEFADGMQLTVAPPAPRYYQGRMPGQPNPFLQPGATNTMTTAPIPPSLLSAAAATNAPPVPAPAPATPPAK